MELSQEIEMILEPTQLLGLGTRNQDKEEEEPPGNRGYIEDFHNINNLFPVFHLEEYKVNLWG